MSYYPLYYVILYSVKIYIFQLLCGLVLSTNEHCAISPRMPMRISHNITIQVRGQTWQLRNIALRHINNKNMACRTFLTAYYENVLFDKIIRELNLTDTIF